MERLRLFRRKKRTSLQTRFPTDCSGAIWAGCQRSSSCWQKSPRPANSIRTRGYGSLSVAPPLNDGPEVPAPSRRGLCTPELAVAYGTNHQAQRIKHQSRHDARGSCAWSVSWSASPLRLAKPVRLRLQNTSPSPYRNRDRPFRASTRSVTMGWNDRSCLAGIADYNPSEFPVTIGWNTR